MDLKVNDKIEFRIGETWHPFIVNRVEEQGVLLQDARQPRDITQGNWIPLSLITDKHVRCPTPETYITLVQLLMLLSSVPTETKFQLGPPPNGIENTLYLNIHCVLPPENMKQAYEKALSLPCCQKTECYQISPINEPKK